MIPFTGQSHFYWKNSEVALATLYTQFLLFHGSASAELPAVQWILSSLLLGSILFTFMTLKSACYEHHRLFRTTHLLDTCWWLHFLSLSFIVIECIVASVWFLLKLSALLNCPRLPLQYFSTQLTSNYGSSFYSLWLAGVRCDQHNQRSKVEY